MSNYLEENNLKTFQPISLRTDLKNKYVTLNTNSLVDIFPFTNKNNYNKDIRGKANEIWEIIFNISDKKFKFKDYSFNHQISTDGYSVSISFIKNSEIFKKNIKLDRQKNGRDKVKNSQKGKSEENIKLLMEQKEEDKIIKKKKLIEKNILDFKQKQKEFKELPKEDQEKLKFNKKINNEFNYIEDLVNVHTFLSQLKKDEHDGKLVYVDPGKRSIGTFMGENGYFNYTSKMRTYSTKRTKYNKLIDSMKQKTLLDGKTVKKWEEELSYYNKKTIDLDKFESYMKIKISMKDLIEEETKYNTYLQKLKWFLYLNTKKHENKILEDLRDKYGSDATMIVGDWSDKCRLSYISTPGVGFRKMLSKKFKVHLLGEYNTSKLSYKTDKETTKLKLHKNGELCELYPVLTYQMGNGRMGCINRDKNATLNYQKIVRSLIETQKRPEAFTRPKNKKNSVNPQKTTIKSVSTNRKLKTMNK